jgi:Leucine-rich repeat (LRR) protein
MLNIIKKVFYNSDRETIRIFEETTKIGYKPNIFKSLKVLSISHTKLQNLEPLRVFKNLEVLNLSHNRIQDIEPLEDLKNLRVLDLRFNKIRRLPSWIFKTDKDIHWERVTSNQEGIFLEGNPLDKNLILKISKNQERKKRKTEPKKEKATPKQQPPMQKNFKKPKISKIEEMKEPSFVMPKVEQLIPLNRQRILIFKALEFQSNFIEIFISDKSNSNNQLKLNISIIDFEEKNSKVTLREQPPKDLEYAVIILNNTKCCLYPPILKKILEEYRESKIFLIIEDTNEDLKNSKRVNFLKSYNRFKNIVGIYHFSKDSNSIGIRENIYNYLNNTIEVKSLWKKSWIDLRDEIEEKRVSNIEDFLKLAKKFKLSKDISDYLYRYLVKVGSIR